MKKKLTADEYIAWWDEWMGEEAKLENGEQTIQVAELGPIDMFDLTGSDQCGWVRDTNGRAICLCEGATGDSRYNHRAGQKYKLTVEGGKIRKAELLK